MRTLILPGCTTRPFGSYLKALAILRLVSEQVESEARAWWHGETLNLSSNLSGEELLHFFLQGYSPTPILAPWNGGSGFYENDRKVGIDAIALSTSSRFAEYRNSIAFCRGLSEVKSGRADKNKEEDRRASILRACRNHLPDRAVEWIDASVGIAADGSRSFAPVLGTGGNEGRLDYTNNFTERLVELLISPDEGTAVRELLENALFATPTESFLSGKAGQFDPGRAGGANQGQGIKGGVSTNPWDFILTMEGAVAWASGLYRRHGVSYGSLLCSPFTVKASTVGYGSASGEDGVPLRAAEIWAPIWRRPARYPELQTLLREGRATVTGRPARNGIEFAEAATSLGVDRGIDRFMRFSLLKRRGDSYVALPTGYFPAGYRSETDRVREFEDVLSYADRNDLPEGCESLRRSIDSCIYEVLLHGKVDRMRAMMASFGRLLRRLAITGRSLYTPATLHANRWLEACGWDYPEVRIAAALASIWDREIGSIRENLSSESKHFAWTGRDLPDRLIHVLQRRLQLAIAAESDRNPFNGACGLDAGDATLFIEGSVDDALVEDLIFAFTCLDWSDFRVLRTEPTEILPTYAVLKFPFFAGHLEIDGEKKQIWSDPRIISQLAAGHIEDATKLATDRLRIAGLRPLDVSYYGGVDARRLAAALLIPVRISREFLSFVHKQEKAHA